MSSKGREAALAKLKARRQEIRRALTSVEQQIVFASRRVLVIQQQIANLMKSQRKAA